VVVAPNPARASISFEKILENHPLSFADTEMD
jgi:hypothetical protein